MQETLLQIEGDTASEMILHVNLLDIDIILTIL